MVIREKISHPIPASGKIARNLQPTLETSITMSEKKLEKGSTWEAADLDHDGVITDKEIQLTEKMIRLENNDKMADQQRMMVWVSLISVIAFVGIMLTPLVSIERVNTLISFANTRSFTLTDLHHIAQPIYSSLPHYSKKPLSNCENHKTDVFLLLIIKFISSDGIKHNRFTTRRPRRSLCYSFILSSHPSEDLKERGRIFNH